ncbi:MAG: M3 family oligoendopeptidase [Anaerolineae bacterium]|nr:M3 family oligoendopeptidase [Anaerolineae bacterium]
MLREKLPASIDGLDATRWETFAPYYEALQEQEPTPETIPQWLREWSDLSRVVREAISWVNIEKSQDTTDEAREQAFLDMVNNVYPQAMRAEQALKKRLLQMEIDDQDLAVPLRNIRNEAALFREENIPLITQLQKLANTYDNLTGGLQTVWDAGEPRNLSQLDAMLVQKERALRERAWQATMALWLSERERLNQIYTDALALRHEVAANAGLPDYRAYAFRDRGRFDYTPEDCFVFHEAIAEVVVPAARRILERRQERLGLERLRPWDVRVEPSEEEALQPYSEESELIGRSEAIFEQVDPALRAAFATMAAEALLDLDTRNGKQRGGYCSTLPLRRRPFIFMNGTGTHDDVQTLLHEAGHAFHAFAKLELPLIWQTATPMEFNEVASMAMELLAAPYLTKEYGGFYSEAEAARARIEHLEGILLFLPYMAVVDAFQHWVYTHPEEAADAAKLDATWDGLWQRFMPVTDWSGFEDARMTGWHRKLHIFTSPFYYIEYGMAQVGALQIWRNSLEDQAGALAAYRRALAAGGTRTLPELFALADAEFRFDAAMLGELVSLVETTIAGLEGGG